MRIAMIVPPWYEVPPPGYGGLEQVCAALVDGLVELGQEVTLFGAGSWSGTRARYVATSPELQNDRLGHLLPELAHLARVNALLTPESFDVVHDHTTVGPLLAPQRPVPTVATVHGNPTGELGDILRDVDPSVGLVAISQAQRRLADHVPWIATVHNGIQTGGLPRKSRPGTGPVVWLARFSADKGPELAIRACREAGLPLVLVGKCDEAVEQRHLAEVIEPMLGPDVTLIRNADRDTSLRLLLAARCLIMPIRWEEPFGMVMVEAMGTGTPVVALRRGAVPELIRPGETGLICDDPAELPAALRAVTDLDPAACVAQVERNFSARRMAENYLPVYRAWATGHRGPQPRQEPADRSPQPARAVR
ncbi:glycosyltransferase family 4 protein [Solwaraspora sp. WMMD1047]|uniref:glycosyltransferase family 4 protein n=1 Tax=Solwaraspora sp. WMMD1047 TaxID=3016102 RepID=UPI002416C5C7|nr:glycosyltransferase family 4 protein [Solwaraspora sp. WMMD1047]MDG4833124.1 glycosyltransferase family 4 protein [Solwaraspora sp. WMMD1047]